MGNWWTTTTAIKRASATSRSEGESGAAKQRSIADRFAVPHSFPPDLTISQALVAVGGALVRICLGSLLFALWGVSSALTWSAIPNPLLRAAALAPILLLFLLTLLALLAGVTAVVKKLSPKTS